MMSGTIEGGKQAYKTNLKKYGADFYAKIGAKGGKAGNTGGFHKTVCNCLYRDEQHRKAECAGYKGGLISRRRKI